MKRTNLLLLICIAISWSTAKCSLCDEKDDLKSDLKSCDHNKEYTAYVDCLYAKRQKRAACPNQMQNTVPSCAYGGSNCPQEGCNNFCDCAYCQNNVCEKPCTSCCNSQYQTHNVLQNNPGCENTKCCHRYCNAECSSSSCRKECRKGCSESIGTNVTDHHGQISKTTHNITTIINLHNYINNTNIIDMPVNVNNTNINNITVHTPETTIRNVNVHSSDATNIQQEDNNCCRVIGPRQCVSTPHYPYARCFHYRRKQCGSFCRAPIVHAQPHEICDQTESIKPQCSQQVVYIPQPKPRCFYQSAWPFVSCGAQSTDQESNCAGCYEHYYSGGSAEPQPAPPTQCSKCYDDGFSSGPLYRKAPFFRPGYSHVASCQQTGTCGLESGFGYGPMMPFYGMGYPPDSYENNFHIEPIDNANVSDSNQANWKSLTVSEPEPVYPPFYPMNMMPFSPYMFNPYFGMPMGIPYPVVPRENPPPSIKLEATVEHVTEKAEKNSYARITVLSPEDSSDTKTKE